MKKIAVHLAVAVSLLVGTAPPAFAGNGPTVEWCRPAQDPNAWFKKTWWTLPCQAMSHLF